MSRAYTSRFILSILLSLSIFMLAVGCGVVPFPGSNLKPAEVKPVTEIVTLTNVQSDAVKGRIRKELLDPESAIFGEMIAGLSAGLTRAIEVCGWVNAKNRLGGYAGKTPYFALMHVDVGDPLVSFVIMGGMDRDSRIALQTCAAHGLALP